jgi:hypothetical protein
MGKLLGTPKGAARQSEPYQLFDFVVDKTCGVERESVPVIPQSGLDWELVIRPEKPKGGPAPTEAALLIQI